MILNKKFQGKHIEFDTTKVDLKTNRNAKMIQILMKKSVNGVFLFYLEEDFSSLMDGFILPPGLSKADIESFKYEFMNLFERYAKKVNK